MFLGCSYFFIKSEADVLINSVLRQNTACISIQYRYDINIGTMSIQYNTQKYPEVPKNTQNYLEIPKNTQKSSELVKNI